jgi:cytosine/adenosine deaminase-related metal-dependent hydrolase
MAGYNSVPELLKSYGLLDSSILFAHFNNPTPNDEILLIESNSHASSTPSTEMQMGLGFPVAFNSNIQSHCSLGIDCQSNNSASIVSEMRLLLQASRCIYNSTFLDKGVIPRKLNKTVEEAFNLGTISGARAVGMEDKIGSLKVGKLADIVVFDAKSPAMVCAAQHNAVSAVVLHSSPADIEMVIVDGVVRKRSWMLEPVDIQAGRDVWASEVRESQMAWKDVAKELLKRREILQAKIEKLDMNDGREGLMKAWYIDPSKIADSI